MFICHIEELDIPLGVVVQGTVIGLDIGYELLPESYEEIQKLNNTRLKENKIIMKMPKNIIWPKLD